MSGPRREGDKQVREIQAYLYFLDPAFAAKLDEKGGVDGIRGDKTNDAIRQYTTKNNITWDGTDLSVLLGHLRTSVTSMDKNAALTRMEGFQAAPTTSNNYATQYVLEAFGKKDTGLDGITGNRTRLAFETFRTEVKNAPAPAGGTPAPAGGTPAPASGTTAPETPGAAAATGEGVQGAVQAAAPAPDPAKIEAERRAGIFSQQGELVLINDEDNKGLKEKAEAVLARNKGDIPAGGILFTQKGNGLFSNHAAFVVNADGEVRQVNPRSFDMSQVTIDTELSDKIAAAAKMKTPHLGPDQVQDVSVSVDGIKFNTRQVGVELPSNIRPGQENFSYRIDRSAFALDTENYEYRHRYRTASLTVNGKEYLVEERDLKEAFDGVRGKYVGPRTSFANGESVNWRDARNHLNDMMEGRGGVTMNFGASAESSNVLRIRGNDGTLREARLPDSLARQIQEGIAAERGQLLAQEAPAPAAVEPVAAGTPAPAGTPTGTTTSPPAAEREIPAAPLPGGPFQRV